MSKVDNLHEIIEWYYGPLHPPSLAKNLPIRRSAVPLTSELHPAWNQQKNAIELQNLSFENTSAPDSERKKNSQ